jgi:hypothetical protein
VDLDCISFERNKDSDDVAVCGSPMIALADLWPRQSDIPTMEHYYCFDKGKHVSLTSQQPAQRLLINNNRGPGPFGKVNMFVSNPCASSICHCFTSLITQGDRLRPSSHPYEIVRFGTNSL